MKINTINLDVFKFISLIKSRTIWIANMQSIEIRKIKLVDYINQMISLCKKPIPTHFLNERCESVITTPI